MSIELKVKAASLAAESAIIRNQEHKAKKRGDTDKLQSLHEHRLQVVRPAARSTHLARAFMSGHPYKRIEQTTHTAPNRHAILRLLERYGSPKFRNKTRQEREAILNRWFDAE